MYCTILYYTAVLNNPVLYYTMLYYTMLCYTFSTAPSAWGRAGLRTTDQAGREEAVSDMFYTMYFLLNKHIHTYIYIYITICEFVIYNRFYSNKHFVAKVVETTS